MNENEIYQKLANACYGDNLEDTKEILSQNSNLDLNKIVYADIGKRGNGTPLVLTGSKEIGELLINNGAKINHICILSEYNKITALDSALEELTKLKTKDDDIFLNMIQEYVEYLKLNSAKTYLELKGKQ